MDPPPKPSLNPKTSASLYEASVPKMPPTLRVWASFSGKVICDSSASTWEPMSWRGLVVAQRAVAMKPDQSRSPTQELEEHTMTIRLEIEDWPGSR
ncbi:hypothetical protein V493_01805 [Pseudogymnoascus sp. VKM F-4281 (FW-2241)]|nr:hypothetical protein V493_01805 [Pseudogymnoascus sp. VKM F-4281 (FW-2241)]